MILNVNLKHLHAHEPVHTCMHVYKDARIFMNTYIHQMFTNTVHAHRYINTHAYVYLR